MAVVLVLLILSFFFCVLFQFASCLSAESA